MGGGSSDVGDPPSPAGSPRFQCVLHWRRAAVPASGPAKSVGVTGRNAELPEMSIDRRFECDLLPSLRTEPAQQRRPRSPKQRLAGRRDHRCSADRRRAGDRACVRWQHEDGDIRDHHSCHKLTTRERDCVGTDQDCDCAHPDGDRNHHGAYRRHHRGREHVAVIPPRQRTLASVIRSGRCVLTHGASTMLQNPLSAQGGDRNR
jgi:hypothetical protein